MSKRASLHYTLVPRPTLSPVPDSEESVPVFMFSIPNGRSLAHHDHWTWVKAKSNLEAVTMGEEGVNLGYTNTIANHES